MKSASSPEDTPAWAAGLRARSAVTGRPLLLLALTDLDGTANDEHVPEHARLATVGPAREAFAVLARSGVPTGICTARSFGEACYYREALGITGPIIAENGAVRELADGTRHLLGDASRLPAVLRRIEVTLGRQVPHSLDWQLLESAWEQERLPGSAVFLGHPDRDSLRRSADRLASCYLVGLTAAEKVVAAHVAAEMGFDCFGELLHLIPHGADKGTALGLLLKELRTTEEPDAEGDPPEVIPVVFGNGENDLPLFRLALAAGGVAVLVGDVTTTTGFHFDPARHPIPEGTLCFPGLSHGYAIRASLPKVADALFKRHGVRFAW